VFQKGPIFKFNDDVEKIQLAKTSPSATKTTSPINSGTCACRNLNRPCRVATLVRAFVAELEEVWMKGRSLSPAI
jgi:hypothetical protein